MERLKGSTRTKARLNLRWRDAERKVFDILAVTASDYMPDFVSTPSKKKAFDLRMLRTAIEKSPEDLQIILNEVLGLPKAQTGRACGAAS